jgi:hypothetical protein
VKSRTSLANEIRGLLGERGLIIPQNINKIISRLVEFLDSDLLNEIDKVIFSDKCREVIKYRAEAIAEVHQQFVRSANSSTPLYTARILSSRIRGNLFFETFTPPISAGSNSISHILSPISVSCLAF